MHHRTATDLTPRRRPRRDGSSSQDWLPSFVAESEAATAAAVAAAAARGDEAAAARAAARGPWRLLVVVAVHSHVRLGRYVPQVRTDAQ